MKLVKLTSSLLAISFVAASISIADDRNSSKPISAPHIPFSGIGSLSAMMNTSGRGDLDTEFLVESQSVPRGVILNAKRQAKHGSARAKAKAQLFLAYIYYAGKGVTQNYSKAHNWYAKAGKQGHVEAQYNVAYMYDVGIGVNQDHTKAYEWYSKAAENGNSSAQNNLGTLYERGEGVNQDFSSAYMYYSLSSALNNDHAKANRDHLAKNMTPTQITYAQELTQEWFKKHPVKK